jgi:hypothetical protein
MRHPRLLAVALLAFLFIVPACTDTDKPTQLVTSPDGALHDGIIGRLNNCPVLGSMQQNIDEDSETHLGIPVSDADDPNFEGVYSVIVVEQPEHGDLGGSLTPGGLTYHPDQEFCGEDTFVLKVSDGTCESDAVTAYIKVECVNDCPTCNQESSCDEEWYNPNLEVAPNGSVNFDYDPVDVENDPLAFAVTTGPTHGVVVMNTGTGAGTYTPTAGYCGTDVFAFTVSDGVCTSGPFGVTVYITCPDADGDGVPNDQDDCAGSIVGGTIVIDGCDSGVANAIGEGAADVSGCTLADKIGAEVAAASQSAKNHGKFVSSMAQRLNTMVKSGLITGAQKDALMSCIGSSSLNKTN